MKARIVWKLERVKCGCVRGFFSRSPGTSGGTCDHNGLVLPYDEVSGALKVEGGRVLIKGKHGDAYSEVCCVCRVAAVMDENGSQIYISK